MKLVALMVSAAVLSGCASVVCTVPNMESITTENTRLLKQKAEIDGYMSGEQMPDEKFSRIRRGDLLAARIRNYNESVDSLNSQSNKFNTICIKGKNGGL